MTRDQGTLRPQRRFVSPQPDEDWSALATRALPGEPTDAAVEKLRSWNLHLFLRNPPGVLLGSDVVFVEPPAPGEPAFPGLGS